MIAGLVEFDRADDPCIPLRVLIAPAAGRVRLRADDQLLEPEDYVGTGDAIAVVQTQGADVPVRSRFGGWMKGFLVVEGEPVSAGQPLAWLEVPQ